MTMPTDDERPTVNAAEDDPSARLDPRVHPAADSDADPDAFIDPDDD